MGFLIDSSVFIAVERDALDLDALRDRSALESVALAVITASELLHGVHRANNALRRQRREEFVERILATVPVLDFDLRVARVHAGLWADLVRRGGAIGAHDVMIAATALSHGLTVATRNERHFRKIEGLAVERW